MPSILKVNQIQKTSSTSNIINKSGSTITLGSCGTTVTLACGATSTGFGATSFVDWCTTAKTAPFTGANGTGYFVNTTCGAITVTLPTSPSAGDIISLKDYGGTWATNNVTICGNSSKINGVCATATLNTNSQSVTLIYVDSTKGWQDIQDSSAAVTGNPYLVATGGTVTTCGDYKIHTFTSDATFTVCSTGSPTYAYVDYLVIAGGGATGTSAHGAGSGAGGFRESYNPCISGSYSASPLATPTSLPVTAQAYPITVGGGGSPPCGGNNGSNSIFSTITSAGGGKGGAFGGTTCKCGGSGGGGYSESPPFAGGSGNTPPVSPPQGNSGGTGHPFRGAAGGGGAGAVGSNGATNDGGNGGAGATTSINGSSTTYAGGGGGGTEGGVSGDGGPGGGGGGGPSPTGVGVGRAGTVNTGGGGGGGSRGPGVSGDYAGGAGGSGIVILRYRYQ